MLSGAKFINETLPVTPGRILEPGYGPGGFALKLLAILPFSSAVAGEDTEVEGEKSPDKTTHPMSAGAGPQTHISITAHTAGGSPYTFPQVA